MAFFFCLTNVGLEKALKAEMQDRFPKWRLAFSAPGFITFKGEGSWPVPVLARLWGECVGKGEMPGCTTIDFGPAGVWMMAVSWVRFAATPSAKAVMLGSWSVMRTSFVWPVNRIASSTSSSANSFRPFAATVPAPLARSSVFKTGLFPSFPARPRTK